MHLLCRRITAALLLAAGLPALPAIASDPTALQQAAQTAAADYRQAQRERLIAAGGRDNRIAAALLTLPADANAPIPAATADAARALLGGDADDELALYVIALTCHLQPDCSDRGAVEHLTARAGGNALHWLLTPGAAAPADAALQKAAAAQSAEPHLGALVGVLDKALAKATAPAATGADAAALAAQLRADAIAAIPLPRFAPTLGVCKEAARRDTCLELGRHLFADAQGSILSRMIGSVLLRRLAKGTAEETAAYAFRRDYVWLGEHDINPDGRDATVRADLVRYGEWEAWLRAAERAGFTRTPPAGWAPRNPQQLLLSEERQPAAK